MPGVVEEHIKKLVLGIIAITTLCLACGNQESSTAAEKSDSIDEDVLLEQIAQLKALINNTDEKLDPDSLLFLQRDLAIAYTKIQLWDSVYACTRDIFYDYYYQREEGTEVIESYQRLLNQASELPDTSRAKIEEQLAYVANEEDQLELSADLYLKALNTWSKYPLGTPRLRCSNMLGILASKRGDYDLSESFHRNGVLFSEQLKDTLELSRNYFNLGKALKAQNKWSEGLANFQYSINAHKFIDGRQEYGIAECLIIGKKYNEATFFAEESLKKRSQ